MLIRHGKSKNDSQRETAWRPEYKGATMVVLMDCHVSHNVRINDIDECVFRAVAHISAVGGCTYTVMVKGGAR